MNQNNDVMRELARAKSAEMQVIARTNNQLEEAGVIPRRRPIKQIVSMLTNLASSMVSLTRRTKPVEPTAKAREARRA